MSEEKSKSVIAEDEIERIIKELEKKENEKQKGQESRKEGRELLTEPPPEIVGITKKHSLRVYLKHCFRALIIFTLIYIGLNFKAVLLNIKYIYKNDIRGIAPPLEFNLPEDSKTDEINLLDSLVIPKIQLNVPIVWQVEFDDILRELKNGVAHLKGTALPNEEGYLLLFGRSSAYPWQDGKYNEAFALLNKLTLKDKIIIVYQKKKYFYEVTEKKIINPENIKILDIKTSQLILITNWPLGINFKRLMIVANQTERSSKTEPSPVLPNVQ